MNIINKKKLKDEVFVSLQDAIFGGELKPGDRIVETKIASEMGVSQVTVREALKELEHFGLIESKPYQGTYVKQLTKKELKDSYDARLVLELYAIESAANLISQEELELLRELMEMMDEAVENGDISSFVDYDVRFHEAIIRNCNNEMVEKLWHLVNVSLWTLITTNLSKRTLKNLAIRHMDIYKTLENRDVQAARNAMQLHLLELRDEMTEKIETTE